MFYKAAKVNISTGICLLILSVIFQLSYAGDNEFIIEEAVWDHEKKRLKIKGKGQDGKTVTVYHANSNVVIGRDTVDDEKWRVRKRRLASVPCRVKAIQSDGREDEVRVKEAPDNCDEGDNGGGENNAPVAQNDSYTTRKNQLLTIVAPGVLDNDSDADGDVLTAELNNTVNHGTLALNSDGSFSYSPEQNFIGQDSFSYKSRDTSAALSNVATVIISIADTGAVSINSTSSSSSSVKSTPVSEQTFITNPKYQILAINDLGMHCGDLDTRVSSILPPFNVLHAQVVERDMNGEDHPRVMNKGEVTLSYSAVSNPDDPALSLQPVLAKDNNSLYKTNFWDIALQAYTPFYPSGILAAFYPPGTDIVDVGLPVPDVERLYLEDGSLHAGQQAMPGIMGPLTANEPQPFLEHIGTLPFFLNFDFGYKADVNWFEAAGVPVAVYDDSGRENPYPLMRVQAKVSGVTVATVDTVVPISGEAECQRCHADEADGGNGAATQSLIENKIEVAVSIEDPAENVPMDASIEWASDINILKLHDLKHPMPPGEELYRGFDPATGNAYNPVVCQVCHYTPALDLAQLGPLGPENDKPLVLNGETVADSTANGRDQVKNKTMSNVMHSHHGQFTDLFPAMPPAVDAQGNKRDAELTKQILGETCYACHPGNKTECMRGAMANGGQVCQDCHGDMNQVGDDFSRDVSPTNPNAFHVAGDYYSNPDTPRVPWANEPGCGSCHTGNAVDNLTSQDNVLVNPFDSVGNVDGIRLAQAFRTNDAKATPIVPINKQFAENVVSEGTAADGNPKLYRVSTGHGELFCEACHGATHAEWPNVNPWANDNVAAKQIQGHVGTVTECSVCHEGDLGNTLKGPHGMHAVGDTRFSDGGHEHIAERNDGDACRACHGRSGEGSVLSRVAVDRTLKNEGKTVSLAKGDIVTCSLCHENKLK